MDDPTHFPEAHDGQKTVASPMWTPDPVEKRRPLPRVPRRNATGLAEYVQSLDDRGRLTYLTSLAWTDEFPAAGRPPKGWPIAGDLRAIMPSATLGCAGKDKAQQGRNEREGAYDE